MTGKHMLRVSVSVLPVIGLIIVWACGTPEPPTAARTQAEGSDCAADGEWCESNDDCCAGDCYGDTCGGGGGGGGGCLLDGNSCGSDSDCCSGDCGADGVCGDTQVTPTCTSPMEDVAHGTYSITSQYPDGHTKTAILTDGVYTRVWDVANKRCRNDKQIGACVHNFAYRDTNPPDIVGTDTGTNCDYW